MKFVKASEFKTKFLTLLKEVERTGETFVITKRDKPIAQLVPYRTKKTALGVLKDRLFITGDLISPIDVEWEALK